MKAIFWTAIVIFSITIIGLTAYSVFAPNDATANDKDEKTIPLVKQSPEDLSTLLVDMQIHDQPVDKILDIFKHYKPEDLQKTLQSDQEKLTFWINAYNGYTQYFLKKDPSLYLEDRGKFFSEKQIKIAGELLSMEDIEHGILRKGATKWSLGFVRLPFRNGLVRDYGVQAVDERIHFTLNCGAKSCPPVHAYELTDIDEQLNEARNEHLANHIRHEKDAKIVKVPAFMIWFLGDFGGKNNIEDALVNQGYLQPDQNYKIVADEYDWTMQIDNYR